MEIDRRTMLGGSAATAQPKRRTTGLHSRILGTWTLVDAVTLLPNGEEFPWVSRREGGTGLLIFSPPGFVSFQVAALPYYVTSPSEARGFADRWFGYFGRFVLDEGRGEISIDVDDSYVLSELTAARPRKIQLEGDMLTMTKPPPPTGEARSNRFRWRRA